MNIGSTIVPRARTWIQYLRACHLHNSYRYIRADRFDEEKKRETANDVLPREFVTETIGRAKFRSVRIPRERMWRISTVFFFFSSLIATRHPDTRNPIFPCNLYCRALAAKRTHTSALGTGFSSAIKNLLYLQCLKRNWTDHTATSKVNESNTFWDELNSWIWHCAKHTHFYPFKI